MKRLRLLYVLMVAALPLCSAWADFYYYEDFDDPLTYGPGSSWYEESIWTNQGGSSTANIPYVFAGGALSPPYALNFNTWPGSLLRLDLHDEDALKGADVSFSWCWRSTNAQQNSFGMQAGMNAQYRAILSIHQTFWDLQYVRADGTTVPVPGPVYIDKPNHYYKFEMIFRWNGADYGNTFDLNVWETNNTLDDADDTQICNATGLEIRTVGNPSFITEQIAMFTLRGGGYGHPMIVDNIHIYKHTNDTASTVTSIDPSYTFSFDGFTGHDYQIWWSDSPGTATLEKADFVPGGGVGTTWVDRGHGQPGDPDYRPAPSLGKVRYYDVTHLGESADMYLTKTDKAFSALDGVDSDPLWEDAVEVKLKIWDVNSTPEVYPNPAYVKATFDDSYIYVFYTVDDGSTVSLPVDNGTGHDAGWPWGGDAMVEIMFDLSDTANPAAKEEYYAIATADGDDFDLYSNLAVEEPAAAPWWWPVTIYNYWGGMNPGAWEIVNPWTRFSWNKFSRPPGSATWYAELKIPFSAFNAPNNTVPADGTVWRMNFGVQDVTFPYGDLNWIDAGDVGSTPWHNPANFGKVMFGGR